MLIFIQKNLFKIQCKTTPDIIISFHFLDVVGISDVKIDTGYNQGTLHPQTEYTLKAKVKVHNFQDASWPAGRANFRPRLLLHTSSNPHQGKS